MKSLSLTEMEAIQGEGFWGDLWDGFCIGSSLSTGVASVVEAGAVLAGVTGGTAIPAIAIGLGVVTVACAVSSL